MSVQSHQPIDVTSEDDEEGRVTAVVANDRTKLESSKGITSSPNIKTQSQQKTNDGMNDMNVESKVRLTDSAQKALPTNLTSTKRKSTNFLDEILAEKANKKKRKKGKLKGVDKGAVC